MKYLRLSLKIFAWTIMAVVLFFLGILMGVVNILTPERLTPLTEKLATEALQNCEVKIEKAELTVMSTFPFVHARIDNLVVLSTTTRNLDDETREFMPEYADTVLAVSRFEGGLNVMKLLSNQLDLSDVIIERPSANLVIIDEGTTNFDIIPAKEDDGVPFDWNNIPGISLTRFAIVNPGKVRFYNFNTDTELSAAFSEVELDGSESPYYSLRFDGNIEAPSEFYDIFNIADLKFGLNGSMVWSQENPTVLALNDFEILFSVFDFHVDTEVDFAPGVKFNKLKVTSAPLDIAQLLSMIPQDIAEEYGIPTGEDITTDAVVSWTLQSADPWNISTGVIPPFTLQANLPQCAFEGYGISTKDLSANIELRTYKPWQPEKDLPDMTLGVKIPPMGLTWEDYRVKNFETDFIVRLPEGDVTQAEVEFKNLQMEGPATAIALKGTFSDLFGDMTFQGDVDCDVNFERLPGKILNAIDGSLSGKVCAIVDIDASKSMLSTENFHKMKIRGDVTFNNLYWIDSDTVNMFDVNRALFHFGTTERISANGKTVADSLLRVGLSVDTALILHDDLSMNLSRFNINLAAQNTSEKLTKGRINPMGGKLTLKSFNLLKTNDSTVVRLRDLAGTTVIKAYNNDVFTPQFIFDLNVHRIATGNNESRILITDAHTNFNARRVPKSKSAKKFTHIADSIQRAKPHLPPDSVIYYALQIHNRKPRSKYPRVHEVYDSKDSLDMIDWGASPMFKRILNLWTFEGNLSSRRASIFTPHLPVRNRFRNIDVTFNNDSVSIKNLQYKMGHSDFTVNGIVSNMRKAFTSTTGRQPLRVNFEMLSDTIDVNQITEALIIGSSYAAADESEKHKILHELSDDEEKMEEHIARLTENAPDTVMPILVPENLDAQFNMRSNNVLYSDFRLQNMTGQMLAYGGNLNLRNLSASSEVGAIDLSALYSGLHPDDLRFGFGLKLNDFHINRFLKLVPAVDSILPVMRDFGGVISVDIAATTDIDRNMNLILPSLDAAIDIQGDSLVILSPETFSSVAKWLLFKDKKRNIIDHMNVQMIVRDNQIDVYPFIFDFDRYKIGVQGYNDFNLNFNYHVAVLKSPIPFKFGINISGNPDKYKVRLGGAKFGEQQLRQVAIVDTTRINLMNEINNVFRRGARDARLSRLKIERKPLAAEIDLNVDTLTHADSLLYIREGLIDAPPQMNLSDDAAKKQKRQKNKKNKSMSAGSLISGTFSIPLVGTLYIRIKKRREDEDNVA